ncbi:hypothetical protein JOC77_000274 [Peribacillus deserti]|uniref:Uncharacterized protein n=1 Tax=Peribacillus deserti TaxID=673318 RepID=A0ABS2QCI9_9BACI|nr:hypothetical protein [Peribacillus deserti]
MAERWKKRGGMSCCDGGETRWGESSKWYGV